MATIGVSPIARAPRMTLSPTPPRPNTATDAPASTFAVFTTAPTPVVTVQPKNAAFSNGSEWSILTSDSAAAMAVMGES